MKQRIFMIICVSLLVMGMIFFSGCKQEVLYDISLPEQDSLEGGYLSIETSIYYRDDPQKNQFRVEEKSTFEFIIEAEEGYTLDDIVVKDNGKVMSHVDDSNESTQTFRFKLENIKEKHTITIEGIRKIKSKVKLAFPKYKQQQDSQEGTIYDQSFNMLKFKYGDTVFYDLYNVISHVNSQNIELEYGEKFELWVGEISPKFFQSVNILYSAPTNDFDGIFAVKNGNEFQNINNPATRRASAVIQGDEYVYQDFMYKYEIEIKEDTTIYINTLALEKQKYWVNMVNNDVYKFQVNNDDIYYDTSWSFDLTLNYYEEYPQMYEDIDIYINNTKITDWMELTFNDVEGTYHFTSGKGDVPSAYDDYQNPQTYDTFFLKVEGINLDANGDNEETKIIFNENEYISNAHFYDKDGNYNSPYYFLNGDYYYLKTEEYIDIYFEDSPVYDYSEMVVKVNNVPVIQDQTTDITLTNVDSTPNFSSELHGYWRIRIEGEYEDVYEISVNGLKKRELHYTAKNDYKNESELYLILDDQRILIENNYSFTLLHGQEFEFELIVESEDKAEEFEEYLTGIVLDYGNGNYRSIISGDKDGKYSIQWELKANAYIYEGNQAFEVVKK